MLRRVHRLRDRQLGASVGAVFVRLAAFVLHHLALPLQLFVGDHLGQRREPIRLQPEKRFEQVARADLVVVRAIVAGGAVVVAAPALHDRVERGVGRVARPHEHQVLEQVREAGPPGRFVLRSDVVPYVDGDERTRVDPRGGSPVVRWRARTCRKLSSASAERGRRHLCTKVRRPGVQTAAGIRAGPPGSSSSRCSAWAGPARGNGALPASFGILLPADRPEQIVLATNFGMIFSEDGGTTWLWTCEQAQTALGYLYGIGPSPRNRFYGLSPEQGLAFSDDNSCTWRRSGGALSTLVASDFFVDRGNPDRVVAVASTVDRRPRGRSGSGGRVDRRRNDLRRRRRFTRRPRTRTSSASRSRAAIR